ncbi:GGDEF domain-containing protein [Thiomicrospira pelophila]|uniref:GGDEF domain-containing protein n=1 Tax=Thiomicrospira pelophila TaxID=934 RepID=UPI0009DCE36C|nr:GGDEF domain-containing protein [Thiomicrospira pelophila]
MKQPYTLSHPIWAILPGLVVPLILALVVPVLFGIGVWPNIPLHSTIEGAGVLLNLILGLYLILLIHADKLCIRFYWAASSFIAMAVIGAFHGSVEPGNTFVGLHSMGVLMGGLLFSFIALPKSWLNPRWLRQLPWLSFFGALGLSFIMLLTSHLFPNMLHDGGVFSTPAIAFNTIGATGFFIASLKLMMSAESQSSHQTLAVLTLMFAVSAVLFDYSTLWDATWWLWHFLRLAALSFLLAYFFMWFYQQTQHIRHQAEKLETLAFRDALTQLPNRALFYQQLAQELKQAQRNQHNLALLFIDLDRFKHVNDNLGHDIGDKLLIAVTQRLSHALRQADLLARMGGDEFTVILNGAQTRETAGKVAQNIIDCLSPAYEIEGHTLQIGASIGIAFYPDDAQELGTLMRLSDTAMYLAKSSGRNTYRFYEASLIN